MSNLIQKTTEGLVLHIADRFGSIFKQARINKEILYMPLEIALRTRAEREVDGSRVDSSKYTLEFISIWLEDMVYSKSRRRAPVARTGIATQYEAAKVLQKWSSEYDADALPQDSEPAWIRTVGTNPLEIEEIVDGKLHIKRDAAGDTAITYKLPYDFKGNVDYSYTLRYKNITAQTIFPMPPEIRVEEDVYQWSLGFFMDRIIVGKDIMNIYDSYYMDTSDDYHIYRAEVSNGLVNIYVDGILRISDCDVHIHTPTNPETPGISMLDTGNVGGGPPPPPVSWQEWYVDYVKHGSSDDKVYKTEPKAVIEMFKAVPVDMTFSITMWTKYKDRMDAFIQEFIFWQQENPNIDLFYEDDKKLEFDILIEPSIAVDYETISRMYREGKYWRHTFNILVEVWLIKGVTVKTAKEIILSAYFGDLEIPPDESKKFLELTIDESTP